MTSDWFESTERIENDGPDELVLVVEPWASEYALPPGAAYVVRAKSHIAGALELERERHLVICWAWPGSTAEVWSNDQLVESFVQPVPAVPQGLSVRGFLRGILGRNETA